MNKKVLKKIGHFIWDNISVLLFLIILFFIFTLELPFYIETPGGIIDTDKRIDINGYPSSGSFHLAYVGQLKATLPLYVCAKINPNWDLIPKNKIVMNREDEKDVEFRDRLMLEEGNNTAIRLAYQRANKTYDIIDNQVYVTYIDDLAKTDLQVRDQIIEVEQHKIVTKQQLYQIIQNKEVGDILSIKVKNQKKEYIRKAKVIEYKDVKMIGVIITEKQKIKTSPNIKLHFKNSESGGSGGFMMTLSIYNSLIPEDLTKGLKIVGTGTIEEDGTVGEIDGVKYKLMGAVKKKADLFFVPKGSNYKEAIKVKKQKKYAIDIVAVGTLDDAISYLEKKNG